MNNEDILSVIARLRARDCAELEALGWSTEEAVSAFRVPAVLSKAFLHERQAEALVTFHALTPSALAVSLMATDLWPRVARQVIRWGHNEARPFLLAQGFTRAECRTLEGHDNAIRFLERFGFTRECDIPDFGARGATFLQYAWRLKDHVPFQITQTPATAAATAA